MISRPAVIVPVGSVWSARLVDGEACSAHLVTRRGTQGDCRTHPTVYREIERTGKAVLPGGSHFHAALLVAASQHDSRRPELRRIYWSVLFIKNIKLDLATPGNELDLIGADLLHLTPVGRVRVVMPSLRPAKAWSGSEGCKPKQGKPTRRHHHSSKRERALTDVNK
jgi:hypothetical protein